MSITWIMQGILIFILLPFVCLWAMHIIRPRDLQRLDDNRFYTLAVLLEAHEMVANVQETEVPLHEAMAAPEQEAVIVLVRPPIRSRACSLRSTTDGDAV